MKGKLIWLILSCLLALSLVLASCGTNTTPTTTSTTKPTTIQTTTLATTATTKTTAPTTTAGTPQYGDTITMRINANIRAFDPYNLDVNSPSQLWYETLCIPNFAIPESEYDFKGAYTPFKYWTGLLAESWEISPDAKTYTFHIRKGIRWQDIAPVSGRELTASDIEYSFHRQLGLGSGFTKPNPVVNIGNYAQIQSITATDKYTLVFQLKAPSLDQYYSIIDAHNTVQIVARDAVEKWGSVNDWKQQIGTGAFMMDDWVDAASLSVKRNPNYWRYDPLLPNNKLPYVDAVKILIIPDTATALAALRTGKIDFVPNLSITQRDSLRRTNPELKEATALSTVGYGIVMQVDRAPYNDIRVRKAMQMAIDLKAIAQSFFGGTIDGTPMGIVGLKGYYTPFDKWPQEVKDGYVYNPTSAKKLLADAGYPKGFKATITTSSASDLDLLQILKSYLADIGIDMSINVMDNSAYVPYKNNGNTELCFEWCTVNFPPVIMLNVCFSGSPVYYPSRHIKDATFDDLRNKAATATTEDDQRNYVMQANDRAIAQQWITNVPPPVNFYIYQPWLKRYNAQGTVKLYAWLWIDQKLKKSMGR